MNLRYVISIMLILVMGLLIFGLVQSSLPQDAVGQTEIGLVAAGVIAAGAVGYAAVMLAGRNISRARLEQTSYPTDVEDSAPTSLPQELGDIDTLLTSSGFTLDSERRGLRSADGSPAPAWHYHSADYTAGALIALSSTSNDVGMLLTTYFEDETQLTTRLSRTIPKIERASYESHSVDKPGDLIRLHSAHVQRLAAAHGKPLRLDTFEAEHRLAAKTYQQNMGYLFDAMWRRNLVWLAAVEGIGLLALAGGLVQLLDPALSPVKGLVILVGGAALMATLALSGIVSLRRSARQQPG